MNHPAHDAWTTAGRRLLTKGTAWQLQISPKRRVVELDHIIPGR